MHLGRISRNYLPFSQNKEKKCSQGKPRRTRRVVVVVLPRIVVVVATKAVVLSREARVIRPPLRFRVGAEVEAILAIAGAILAIVGAILVGAILAIAEADQDQGVLGVEKGLRLLEGERG